MLISHSSKQKASERGEGEIAGLVILAVLGLAIWGGINVYTSGFGGGESEGTVKFEDCRQIITVKQGDWDATTKNFVYIQNILWQEHGWYMRSR